MSIRRQSDISSRHGSISLGLRQRQQNSKRRQRRSQRLSLSTSLSNKRPSSHSARTPQTNHSATSSPPTKRFLFRWRLFPQISRHQLRICNSWGLEVLDTRLQVRSTAKSTRTRRLRKRSQRNAKLRRGASRLRPWPGNTCPPPTIHRSLEGTRASQYPQSSCRCPSAPPWSRIPSSWRASPRSGKRAVEPGGRTPGSIPGWRSRSTTHMLTLQRWQPNRWRSSSQSWIAPGRLTDSSPSS